MHSNPVVLEVLVLVLAFSCFDISFYTAKGAHDTSFAIKAGLFLCVIYCSQKVGDIRILKIITFTKRMS